jgi:5-methylcytosine-specific restriction protein A
VCAVGFGASVAQRNPRPCKTIGCPNLSTEGFCNQCVKEGKARKIEFRPNSRERGYNARWEKYRAFYLRAYPFCIDPFGRHRGIQVEATRVDHVKPHRGNQELFWDERNHQGLCESCHNYKTAKYDGGFGRRRASEEPWQASKTGGG